MTRLYKRRKHDKNKAPISLGGRVFEPSLPFPWVEYPKHYGTFFRFAETESGPYGFCSCYHSAISNADQLSRLENRAKGGTSTLFLRGLDFSKQVYDDVKSGANPEDLIRETVSGACHRCSKVPPTRRYCHEMYGGSWKQHFGWYINLACYEGGFGRMAIYRRECLSHITSDEVLALHTSLVELMQQREILVKTIDTNKEAFAQLRLLDKQSGKVKRSIERFFENEARQWFGFRLVGDAWVSETLLFQAIQIILPKDNILRHYRPDWLEGLELDVYIPRLNIGFEYQGQQHAKPVKHWGGKKALDYQKARDRKKRQLCAKNGCKLIEVWYDEPMTVEFIREKMRSV